MSDLTQKVTSLLAKVDEAVNMSGEQMQVLGSQLGEAWDIAKDEGNERLMSVLTLAWEQAQALHQQTVHGQAQSVGLATVATETILERDAVIEEMSDMEDAMANGDEDHPRLADYAASIREDAQADFEESMEEWMWPEAMEQAYESVHEDLEENISGLVEEENWRTVHAFVRALFGGHPIDDRQRLLLKTLVHSFEVAEAVAS